MKVDKLHIRSRFKNLENVRVEFDEDHLMTVIVGRNGSGKSNVLEALVAIFRNLDLGEKPPFSYELVYRLGQPHKENQPSDRWLEITIDADPSRGSLAKQYIVGIRDLLAEQQIGLFSEKIKNVPFSKVKRDKEGNAPYLPKYVFAYYSGPSDRLENYFKKHRADFYRRLLQEQLDLQGDIRPLFYAKPFHSQFVLLAFFLNEQNSTEKDFLREHLGIEGLDSIHFVMRQPGWAKQKGELFWGASGVVRRFLDELIKYSLSPVKVTRQEDTSLTGSNISNEFFHLFLPDVNALREFARELSADELFKMLESTLLSEIISEVSIRVKVSSSEEPLTFRELSEGEQQLLTVLGLLKFTGGKDSLFLLDEPDTHLNPSWAVKYLQFLRDFVPNHETSHLLMVTHHPLAIAELKKQQVQVMWKDDDNQVHSKEPYVDPRGIGFMATLTEIFGLNTTIDLETQKLIDERNVLARISERTSAQEDELAIINDKLNRLGFSFENREPLYNDFLMAWQDVRYAEKPPLTPDQLLNRREAMKKVIEKLMLKKEGDK
ncbi:chromosome segregation protein SMC [Salmonella enterica subsp. enterica serovar Putten]|uniref:Chromosome segregation protein SMC n=1 Tax=Salmonella enterica subsp. enterica serovar Hofit TaxID=2564537 RepID=A0A5W8MKN8_SALET|nr:chromosome segregation protein SMC [Salmonella enterica]EBS3704546.1 chromosome segregation protein SMC [Salmonella enterica subsp. enterica serovar Putten]EBY1555866.1 chromosome segregation protein SMC [Salmonella enterica subsp. enterica serovar Hofit]EDW0517428.1 AAA family ATPase [Salmonella enterica subsp. enterica]HAK7669209.1 AAA family ATPase [Salmonella enterica]